LEELAVGLEEPDREKERLRRVVSQQLERGRRDRVGARRADVDHVVVTQHGRIAGDVLLADQR
jgi:hypothetical protein